ncbi:MAG: DUF5107 domain-containing protein [Elusimicrobiota bacterium]|nr:DUF5107 domain-containing protein [Elusimicrobiota bacterium]
MTSLLNKKTGREFLYQTALKELKIPPYGAPFDAYDSSGYDEVFPSIDRTFYPSGFHAGVVIPDHGEIWAVPWEITQRGENGFTAQVKSKTLPYIFTRKVELDKNKVVFFYRVENTSDKESFKFLWALHALLACTPATKLLTPAGLNRIMTVEHGTRTLGEWGTFHPYPLTKSVNGKTIDMSATEPIYANNCEKFYFASRNTEGWCGAEHTDTGERIIYRYDGAKVPYLGVWKTQGGYRGDYNVALEPCTAIYDDLYVANKIKKVSEVPPKGLYQWNLTMSVEQRIS